MNEYEQSKIAFVKSRQKVVAVFQTQDDENLDQSFSYVHE